MVEQNTNKQGSERKEQNLQNKGRESTGSTKGEDISKEDVLQGMGEGLEKSERSETQEEE